jgi:uncharacterized membrane protein (UPF0127 family)
MPSFLQPLLRHPDRRWTLVDADTGAAIVARVSAAIDSASRRKGLLGRSGLDDEALVIAPCNAVHTFFMRFAIDILFVDRDGHVRRTVENVGPWRVTGSLRAFATIECAAGTLSRTATRRGHRLVIRESVEESPR